MTTLLAKHVTLHEEIKNMTKVVAFNFLGKDSIRYENMVSVEPEVFEKLMFFKNSTPDGEEIFSLVTAKALNDNLNAIMKGKIHSQFENSYVIRCLLFYRTECKGFSNIRSLCFV